MPVKLKRYAAINAEKLPASWPRFEDDDNFSSDSPTETETYIPVSVLLSDEVVEQLAARLYSESGVERPTALTWSRVAESVREMYRQDARAHLQAAIKQVGGGQDA